MWITIDNEHTRRLKRPWMDEPVEFSDNGTAQVQREVGERLCEELAAVHPKED